MHIIFQLQKTKDKEKILKISEETKLPNIQRSKDKNVIILLFRNHVCKKRAKWNISVEKKKITNLENCIQQNYTSKMKEK